MGGLAKGPGAASKNFTADRWVNLMNVQAGRYAVATFHGTASEIEGAWTSLDLPRPIPVAKRRAFHRLLRARYAETEARSLT